MILTSSMFPNRVITSGKTSGTTQALTAAPPDSIYQKVFVNNMNENSYENDFEESMLRLLKEDRSTLFIGKAYIDTSVEYSNCLVGTLNKNKS